MGTFMYWTGVVFWLTVTSVAAWFIIGEFLIVGFATSISQHRWHLSDPQSKFRWREHWWPLTKSVCAGAVEHAGYRNDGSLRIYTVRGGEWRGIGDWTPISPPHTGDIE